MTRSRIAALAGCLALFVHSARAADMQVTIDNFSFSPTTVTVAVGTKIHFLNRDDIPHTVVDAANPRTIKSPPLDTDDSYDRVFDKPGTYTYFCSLHPHMTGTVIVK